MEANHCNHQNTIHCFVVLSCPIFRTCPYIAADKSTYRPKANGAIKTMTMQQTENRMSLTESITSKLPFAMMNCHADKCILDYIHTISTISSCT